MTQAHRWIAAGLLASAAAACSPKTARHERGAGLGEVMAEVGRRFQITGQAALAGRFELASFEVGELEEVFSDDVPKAALPEEGPTAHIPGLAQKFLAENIPELKKGAASHDAARFSEAFRHAAAACNSCHEQSEKGFIQVSAIAGHAIPSLEPLALSAEPAHPSAPSLRALPLPGASAPASLDYIAIEPLADGRGARVWVPTGGTGSVDVFDVASDRFDRIDGFKTAERTSHGQTRVVGPSSVAIGAGFAYVGDRASSDVCPVDLATHTLAPCFHVSTPIDGLAFLWGTREVWVTTPEDGSITILDASAAPALKLAATVRVAGRPEGFAVDEAHGLFITNLEDTGRTIVVDAKTRAVKATWGAGCGEAGPRGVAIDGVHSLVMVACTDRIQVLDGARDGAPVATLETGDGVDNLYFDAGARLLYVAAAKAARLSVVHVGVHGELNLVSEAPTRDGARNAVADGAGNAYLTDAKGASLLVVAKGR